KDGGYAGPEKGDDCPPSEAQEVFRHRFMGYVLSVTAFCHPTGYAANGNLVSSATATSGVWNNLTLSRMHDSFGNRKTQTPSGTKIMAPVPQAQSLNYYP